MKTKSLILTAIALCFAVNASFAQLSLSSKAKAEIIAPLTITDDSGLAGGTTLDFGVLMNSPINPGTCILSTANSRTVTGGVNAHNSSTTVATFGVTGIVGLTYAISLPAAAVTVTRNGGAETMTINSFTALPASAGADGLVGTIAAAGTDAFTVGGTLNIAAAQAEGVYEGTFSVSIAYN